MATEAGAAYEVGPRLIDPLGVANDGLGFSVSAAPITSGGAYIAGGSVGTYVAIARLLPGATVVQIEQRLESGIANDSFGLAVALGGPEGELLAIGAPADDSFGLNTGRVYLYRRPAVGGMYALMATVNPPAPAETGNFGTAVAISADGSRLATGEPKAQQANIELGAVHVYDLSGPSISAPTTLYSDLGTGGRFGQSLVIDGNRIVVGAPLADDPAMVMDTGALRVLTLVGGLSFEGPPLYADDRANGDRLGLSVALSGDVLIGGAGNDDKPAGIEAGSAYVFRRNGSWQQEAKLRSTQAQAQERFGQAVAVHGTEILVGAYCLNASGCIGAGAVYVYQFDGSQWLSQTRLTATDGANFGHALSYARDQLFAVGAFGSNGAFTGQGALYVAYPADGYFADGFEN
ncbi:MAG: hypothetical protein AB7E72_16655 [Lysobacterales bacterium]